MEFSWLCVMQAQHAKNELTIHCMCYATCANTALHFLSYLPSEEKASTIISLADCDLPFASSWSQLLNQFVNVNKSRQVVACAQSRCAYLM